MLYIEEAGKTISIRKVRTNAGGGEIVVRDFTDSKVWKASVSADGIVTLTDVRGRHSSISSPTGELYINGEPAPADIEEVKAALEFTGEDILLYNKELLDFWKDTAAFREKMNRLWEKLLWFKDKTEQKFVGLREKLDEFKEALSTGKADKVDGAATNNFVFFGSGGNIKDSGLSVSNEVDLKNASNQRIPTEYALAGAVDGALGSVVTEIVKEAFDDALEAEFANAVENALSIGDF